MMTILRRPALSAALVFAAALLPGCDGPPTEPADPSGTRAEARLGPDAAAPSLLDLAPVGLPEAQSDARPDARTGTPGEPVAAILTAGGECVLVTFEGQDHLSKPVTPSGAGVTFSDNWRIAVGNFGDNPSGTGIAAWLPPDIAEIHFDPPVTEVEFHYTTINTTVEVAALDAGGGSLASVPLATTGSFHLWDPVRIEAHASDITTLRFTGAARRTGIDDLFFCRGITVEIDVKPGDEANAVNPKSRGLLPVAVLSTQTAAGESVDFDAATVDPATVALGDGAAPETPVAERGNGQLMASLEDVDNDGDVDFVLHFETQDLVAKGDLDADTEELVLTGETTDGTPIRGTDDVTVVGGGQP